MSDLISLESVLGVMDFISDVSLLVRVEPGPEFRLVTSNYRAKALGIAPANLHETLMRDFLPKAHYQEIMHPYLVSVLSGKVMNRDQQRSPYPDAAHSIDVLCYPIMEGETCTHLWIIMKRLFVKEDLEQLSYSDELTGVANRRYLFDRLERSLSRYLEHGIPFWVMLIDCDDFKRVNDSLGHQGGDELLRQLAQRVRASVRDSDLVARIGGDEFMVLLEEVDSQSEVMNIADRILTEVQTPFVINQHPLPLTVSIGIAGANREETVRDVFQSVDQALYEAKSQGRNKYVRIGG